MIGSGFGSGWAHACSIDDVLERMAAIDAAHPYEDGVATFNRMYTQVTRLVRDAVSAGTFGAGPFLERLDVHFANLFFTAYAADLAGRPVDPAWVPLFEERARAATHPLQFALAGMNTHICHDLPVAVVQTCEELGIEPVDGSPEHHDFTTTNHVLRDAKDRVKEWFTSGAVARIDDLGGEYDDRLAMFGIDRARAAAWEVAQVLWRVRHNPRLHGVVRGNLSRGVGLASRSLLL